MIVVKKVAFLCIALCLSVIVFSVQVFAAEPVSCKQLEAVFQTKVVSEDGICKLDIKRKQSQFSLNGIRLNPEMAELGFMANFQKLDDKAAVIGEFALFEEETNPVIAELIRGGLLVTALHNHLIGESPRILYVHFEGTGELEQLAKAVKAAIGKASE